jgi:hypothetical protein
MTIDLYLHFSDGRIGVTRFEFLRDAADMFSRFDDDENRQRHGVCRCWIAESGSSFVILGDAPQGWTPGHPVQNQAAPQFAHP